MCATKWSSLPRSVCLSSHTDALPWLSQITQYTSNYKNIATNITQKTSFVGNNSKSLNISIDASLKKLRTHYVDILYVHWWDYTTSVEEVMNSLHNLVVQGKVLYLGVSDTPAWIVSKANQYARDHALTPFSIYQGAWSILQRDFERDIIPMARAEGMCSSAVHTRTGILLTYVGAQGWLSHLGTCWRVARFAQMRRRSAVGRQARGVS